MSHHLCLGSDHKRGRDDHYRCCYLFWSLVISDYKRIASCLQSALPSLLCEGRALPGQCSLASWHQAKPYQLLWGHYWKKGLSLLLPCALTFLLLCQVTVMLYRMSEGIVLCLQGFADSWGALPGSPAHTHSWLTLANISTVQLTTGHSLSNKF